MPLANRATTDETPSRDFGHRLAEVKPSALALKTTLEHGDNLGSMNDNGLLARSMSVTSTPSNANVDAYSQAIGPQPGRSEAGR